MNRLVTKIIAAIVTFIVPLVCMFLPFKVSQLFESRGAWGRNMLSNLMCFGGGVFFATYMLHMGPEVRTLIKHSLLDPLQIKYPLADFIMACGFFIVLFMEKFAIALHKARKRRKNCRLGRNRNCEKDIGNGNCPCDSLTQSADPNQPLGLKASCGVSLEDLGEHLKQDDVTIEEEADDELDDPHATRSIVLMLALSFHRIFEGMSVGLQKDWKATLSLLLAVMCHESVIGFSLGLQVVRNHALLVSSFIMPFGVAMGIVISEVFATGEGGAIEVVNGVLQALATGTFIYVTFFEILQDEISDHEARTSQLLSLVFGFGLMAALTALPESSGETLKHFGSNATAHLNDTVMANRTLLSN